MTITFETFLSDFLTRQLSDSPLRFIKVSGLASSTVSPPISMRPTKARHSSRFTVRPLSARQRINDHKAQVVPRILIRGTGISEAEHQPVFARTIAQCRLLALLGVVAAFFTFSRSLGLFAFNFRLSTFFDLRFEVGFLNDDDRCDDWLPDLQ